MERHPNILNNLLANLREKYFPGQFKDYVQTVGIGDTYLRKLESGEILQPNAEKLALLIKAYSEQWGPVIELLTEQINNKAYSADPNWPAVDSLWYLVNGMAYKLPCETLIQYEEKHARGCNAVFYNHPDSTLIVSTQTVSTYCYEDQIRLLHANNVSLFDWDTEDTSFSPMPFASCVDTVLLTAECQPRHKEHKTLHRITAKSDHIKSWREGFAALKKKCMTIEQRMRLINSLHHSDLNETEVPWMHESDVGKTSTALKQKAQTAATTPLRPSPPTPISDQPGTLESDRPPVPYRRPIMDNDEWDP